VETKWEEKDCSHYVPVAELFGFLNLDRFPYYNGVTGETYAAFVTSPDASAYDKLEAVGAWTAPFLAERPEAERELAARFRARVEEAAQPPWLWMEGVRGSKALKQAAEAETRVDAALQAELGRLAVTKAREWTDRQAPACRLDTDPLPLHRGIGLWTSRRQRWAKGGRTVSSRSSLQPRRPRERAVRRRARMSSRDTGSTRASQRKTGRSGGGEI
jgi:hypothetical protein